MPDLVSSVKSIQIQRGIGTSTNGAAAFGATINFHTMSENTSPYATIRASAGSFNTFKESASMGTGILKNGMSFDVRLSKLNSNGYVDYSNSDHQSAYISGAWRNANNLLRINFIHGNERTGISWWGVPADSIETNRTFNPAGQYLDADGNNRYYEGQTDNYKQTHYQLIYSKKINRYFNINTALHYTYGTGYYEQYKDIDYENTYGWGDLSEMALNYYLIPNIINDNDTITHSDLIRRKMMSNHFFGGTLSAQYQRGRVNATIGGGWNKYLGNHFGNLIWMRSAGISDINHEYYRNTGDKTDANIYAKIHYALSEKINIYGDIQYRNIYYQMEGSDDDRLPDGNQKILNQTHTYNFINPKAGIFYQVNPDMQAYLSFAVGHREPTRSNFEDATGDINNIPEAEQMLDYELGYRYNTNKLQAMVNLYFMDYQNQLVPTGEKNSVGYDIMTNVANSYRAGIELSMHSQILKKVSVDANLTLSQNKIKDFTLWATHYDEDWNESFESTLLGETDIAYSPNVIASGALNVNIFKGLNFSYIAKFIGKQYYDNTMSDQRVIEPYFVNNVQFDYTLPIKKLNAISLRFNINNIFNTMYSSNAYGGVWYEQGLEKTWAYYYPQAGRNYMGSICISF
jgi:iron complex outermembrane receptor protein